MKILGLFPLPGLSEQPERVGAVLARLSVPGTTLLCRRQDAELTAISPAVCPVDDRDFWSRSECIVALGGDGTILAAAQEAAGNQKPIFGINLGHVGFLAACTPDETDRIDCLLEDRLIPSRRMMLSLMVNGEERALALNDILLTPRNRGKLLSGMLVVNQKPLTRFRADAILFHTSTGSTGYAVSAGGAVCSDALDLIGVKAVAPYLCRGGHHMLYPPDAVFTPRDLFAAGGPTEAVADGRVAASLNPEDEVVIRRARTDLVLLFTHVHDNQEIYCRKIREAGRETT